MDAPSSISTPNRMVCPAAAAPASTTLGFISPGFYSADYFPLLPWFFLFLTGTALGGWCQPISRYNAENIQIV